MAPTSISYSSPSTNPSWFTPARLLIMFCIINILNYIDRGAIASNGVNGSMRTCDDKGVCDSGSGIQGDFDLNNFQDGILSSAFMVGLLVASPIFASSAKSVNPFRLIGVGLSVWTFATASCGSSFDFWSIAISRMLVGVGEASFISLAAPFIDDNAPPSQKTVWLAAFYMTIPTGVALGYVYGGIVGSSLSWRYAFWIEALLMLPFAVMGFLVKPLQLKGFSPNATAVSVAEDSVPLIMDAKEGIGGEGSVKVSKQMLFPSILGQLSIFSKELKALLLERVYVVNVLGYIAYTFVLGAYSYWGPKVGYNIYHMPSADMMFGGITVVCGILGTLAGGLILDRVDATICNAFKLLSGASFFGAIFCFSAFCLKSLNAFIIIFAIGELSIFAAQAPVNYVSLHCVKPSFRPLSMAMSTVSIHVFGDVPSSPLAGVLQDHINNWRVTTLILTAVLFIAAAIWFIGIFLQSKDLFNEEPESEVSTAAAIREPLLVHEDEENPSRVA